MAKHTVAMGTCIMTGEYWVFRHIGFRCPHQEEPIQKASIPAYAERLEADFPGGWRRVELKEENCSYST